MVQNHGNELPLLCCLQGDGTERDRDGQTGGARESRVLLHKLNDEFLKFCFTCYRLVNVELPVKNVFVFFVVIVVFFFAHLIKNLISWNIYLIETTCVCAVNGRLEIAAA